ncbi:MAG: hypothetical protein WCG93_16180 [Paludibacter sp.]
MKLKIIFCNVLFFVGTSIGLAQTTRANSLTSGFFGYVDGATITNLSVDVAFYIGYAPSTAYTGTTGGGLICSTTGTGNVLVNNCTVTGIIDVLTTNPTASIAQTLAKAGGIVCTAASTAKLTIVNSSVNAIIVAKNDATSNITTSALANSAGIVGDVGSKTGQTVEVINCMAAGSTSAISTNYSSFAGGIVGFNYANATVVNVSNCLASNAVIGSGNTNTMLGGIVSSQVNANSLTQNCMALNSFVRATKTTSGDPVYYRIGTKALGTFANNFAMDGLLVQKTVASVGPTTISISSTDASSNHGADLGFDSAGDANVKLNAYVSSNPFFNTIALNPWAGAGLITPTVNNQIMLAPLKYSVENDILTIRGIDGLKQLSIYTVTGKLVIHRMISDTFSVPLLKGFYLFKLDGYKPYKIIVN